MKSVIAATLLLPFALADTAECAAATLTLDPSTQAWATINNICYNAGCEFDDGPNCEIVNGTATNCEPLCYIDGKYPSSAFPKYYVVFDWCQREDGFVAAGGTHLYNAENVEECAKACDDDSECSGFEWHDDTKCEWYKAKLSSKTGNSGTSPYTCYVHSERVGTDMPEPVINFNTSQAKTAVGLIVALILGALCLCIVLPLVIAIFCCGACGYAAAKSAKSKSTAAQEV